MARNEETTPRTSSHLPRSRRPVVLTLVGPVVSSDIGELCVRAHTMLVDVEVGRPVVCDVGALGMPDAVALDALARLQLTAQRLGHRVRLRDASPELRALLARAGLCDVVPPESSSVVESQGQPEDGEEPRGVEERRELDDPTG